MPADQALTLLNRYKIVERALRDDKLTRGDCVVLSVILSHCDVGGQAWPGLERICSLAGISKSTAIRAVRSLEAGRYVVTERELGKSNTYTIQDPLSTEIDSTGVTDDTPQPVSNMTRVVGRTRVTSDTKPVSRMTPTGVTDDTTPVSPVTPELALRTHLNELASENLLPEDRFQDFWKIYPRKDAKQAAEKSWRRQKLDPQADRIVEDVTARIADPGQWTEMKFIPYGSTYLNQARWKDEWKPAAVKTVGAIERDARTDDEIDRANAEQLAKFGLKDAA